VELFDIQKELLFLTNQIDCCRSDTICEVINCVNVYEGPNLSILIFNPHRISSVVVTMVFVHDLFVFYSKLF